MISVLFAYTVLAVLVKTPSWSQEAPGNAYYSIVGLGSSDADSTIPYPFPMAVLELEDTSRFYVRVRFPGLGVLASIEDTVTVPAFKFSDTVAGFRSRNAIYQLRFPKTPYRIVVDVIDRSNDRVVDSRVLPYAMNVEKFKTSAVDNLYEPRTGMGNPLIRREFIPKLLPFTIETNPGWIAREQFDTAGIYSLVFGDPTKPGHTTLSLTVRPASIDGIDSASWQSFKEKARIAFGDQGIPVSSVGDFVVEHTPSRRVIRAGYEFLSKRPDGSGTDYVAAYLTQNAIMLMIAPLEANGASAQYDYVRAIARSMKTKPSH